MIQRLLILLLLILSANQAGAQSTTLRASEHSDFSRIVARLPDDTSWTVDETETGYRLKLTNQATFENPEVLNGFARERISEVVVNSELSQLDFQLKCLCEVTAYMLVSDWLVIDISDVAAELDLPKSADRTADDTQTTELQLPILGQAKERPLTRPVDREVAPRIQELEAALSESLERALAQGLMDETSDEISTQSPNASLKSGSSELNRLLNREGDTLSPGFTTRTSIDRATSNPPILVNDVGEELQCEPDSFVDVVTWATEEPFSEQLGVLRGNVMGEFDKAQSDAVEELAKLYLHFGLGREAKNVLLIDGIKSSERNILESMAEVLDDDMVSDSTFLEKYKCPGNLAFWAFMALDGVAGIESVDDQLLSRTFKGLPLHLQVLLGPRFSKRLRETGAVELARFALEPARSEDVISSEVAFESSNVLLAEGKTSQAVTQLNQIARKEPRMSSDALFQLIELKLESGETIDDDLLTLLQSMKFEVEGSSKKLVFSAVEIQVLTHRGEIVAAMDLLRSLEPEFDPVSFESLLNQVASAAVAFEDDLRFLDIAFARDDFLASPSIENQVAERLISLGFLERATEVVSSSAIGADLTERRYLRAEIAMLQRKFDAVAAILAGVDSPRAQEIREAIGLKLDTESAIPSPTSNVFTDPLDTETENDAPTLLAAGINPSEQSTTTDRQRPLAQAQELIQESELLRNAFIGTLEALPNLVD